jgi:hypothetical protein
LAAQEDAMKKSLFVLAALAGCTAQTPPEMTEAQQASLTDTLAGYTAGPPVSCVNQRLLRDNRSYGEGVIVFSGITRSTLWVNRPAAGCPELRSSRALRTRTPSTQLCRGDIASVFDPVSGIEYGSCALGDFTPYRRAG